ncbi:MAG: DUF4494 domain-containing protein [Bacteroidales bacterium]|nr:DUF4494 domain-containing protein [Bacteroidales bacterium]
MILNNYFECKIRYEKAQDNGQNKKINETYLVNAISFGEAETRIIEEMTPFIAGEFNITDIKKATYSELFESEEAAADTYYKIKLVFTTLDEVKGTEKKTAVNTLARATDLRDAVKTVNEGMKGTMSDYQIASVVETKIMDIFHLKAE